MRADVEALSKQWSVAAGNLRTDRSPDAVQRERDARHALGDAIKADQAALVSFLIARYDELAGHCETACDGELTRFLLADIEAKRRIVERSMEDLSVDTSGWGHDYEDGLQSAGRATLEDLARPYSDHPDFDPGWRA